MTQGCILAENHQTVVQLTFHICTPHDVFTHCKSFGCLLTTGRSACQTIWSHRGIRYQPQLSNTLLSSTSSSSPDSSVHHTHIMLLVLSKFNLTIMAIVEQELNSRPLYMHSGDPMLQTCINWERVCKRCANTKDIPANKVVKHMLDSIEDVCPLHQVDQAQS